MSDTWIFKKPTYVGITYEVPSHLKGISTIDELRARDLAALEGDLRSVGGVAAKKATGMIFREKFSGMALDITAHSFTRQGGITLIASPIHPYRADLAYKRDTSLPRTVCPLTVNALPLLRDGRVLLGVRGGAVASGKIAVIPGGHAEYHPTKYVTHAGGALDFEWAEEIGSAITSAMRVHLLALHPNRDTSGLNVLHTVATELSYEEIATAWEQAPDRKEHERVFPATIADLEMLVHEGALKLPSGTTGTTTPFFQDCFAHYIDSLRV